MAPPVLRNRVLFRDISIRNKFMLVMCAVLLFSFGFLSIASYYTLQRDSMQSVQGKNIAIVEQTTNGITRSFEYGLSISRLVAANNWVQDYYATDSSKRTREQRAMVRSFLNTIVKPHGAIQAMILYDGDGQMVSSSSAPSVIALSGTAFREYYTDLSNRWGTTIYDCRYRNDTAQISLLKPVIHAQTGSIIAALEIIYDPEIMMNLLSAQDAPAIMALIDHSGDVLVHVGMREVLPDHADMRNILGDTSDQPGQFYKNGSRFYAFSSPIADTDWAVLAVVPGSEIGRQAHRQLRVIFLIIIVALLISVVGALALSESLTRPLRSLERCMERVGTGDLEAKSRLSGHDEIGRMSNQFNAMLDRISGLIDQVSNERLAKQESQLLALQAQINPHFLYNTLSGIEALISLGMQDDALWMTRSLEMFYKTSLSGGENIIMLEKELQNVTNYLDILRYRYDGIFDYELSCPESFKQYLITKLTLQPLVENSIHHGIRKQAVHGQLRIDVSVDGGMLMISVTDNGPGIPREVAEHFREKVSSSYGLYNVDARIKLYFGQFYGLSIDTERDRGARVTVQLPAITSRSEIAFPGKEVWQA